MPRGRPSYSGRVRGSVRVFPDSSVLEFLQFLMPWKLLGLILKPIVRIILGIIAVPFGKLFLHRVVRLKRLNAELERDLTMWLRGSLILLIASSNMEAFFFHWVPLEIREEKFWILATRLMLAIGVIEGMPDQALFAIIHPGPPKFELDWREPSASFKAFLPKLLKGLLCQHLNRSSPVLAILTVILPPGPLGWVCYGLGIFQYLIIGLVSSRDRAIDVLRQFDQVVAQRREELAEESPPEDPKIPTEPAINPESQLPSEQELEAWRILQTTPPAEATKS